MDSGKIEVTPANKTEAPTNTGKEKKTRKKKNKMTTVQEEMAVLRKISNAIPPDNKNAQ